MCTDGDRFKEIISQSLHFSTVCGVAPTVCTEAPTVCTEAPTVCTDRDRFKETISQSVCTDRDTDRDGAHCVHR